MIKDKKRYVADFDTTTKPEDCRVWCFSIMEIGNEKSTYIGNDIEEFLQENYESFIWWRYCFEYELLGISIDEVLNTLMALKKECDEIKKIVGDMK